MIAERNAPARWSLLFAVCCAAQPRLAAADVLYVGGNAASDGNDGSAAAPLASIARAAEKAQPGDTVSVRPGKYGSFTIFTSGTAAARIVFQRDPSSNSRPVIEGGVTISADYVTLRGFEVTGANLMGINVYGGSRLELLENVIHDNQRGAIYAAPAEGRPSDDILIQGNEAYRNSLDNSARVIGGGWAGTIQMLGANRLTILENHVHENWGEGISLTVTDGSVAARNTVHDNYAVELYMDHATSSTFDSNLVYETGKTEFFRNLNGSWPAGGIQVSNEPGYGNVPSARDNRIVNNIVVGGRNSFYYWRAPGDDAGLQATLVANNTFYGAKELLLKIEEAPHNAARLINNLFVAAGAELAWVQGTGLEFRSNVWSGGQPRGAQDLIADCGLVKPGGTAAADYRLGSMSSSCVGAGTALSEVKLDFFGGSRVGRSDVGAHQFGSVVPDAGAGGGGAGAAQGGAGGSPGSPVGGTGRPAVGGMAGATLTGPVAGASGSEVMGTPPDEPRDFRTASPGCACRSASGSGGSNWSLAVVAVLGLVARRKQETEH